MHAVYLGVLRGRAWSLMSRGLETTVMYHTPTAKAPSSAHVTTTTSLCSTALPSALHAPVRSAHEGSYAIWLPANQGHLEAIVQVHDMHGPETHVNRVLRAHGSYCSPVALFRSVGHVNLHVADPSLDPEAGLVWQEFHAFIHAT